MAWIVGIANWALAMFYMLRHAMICVDAIRVRDIFDEI